jgi:hypothetical protein
LRTARASIQALADLSRIDTVESGFGVDGRRVARSERISTEGLSIALARLLPTCPPQQDMTSLQSYAPKDFGAK